MNPDKEIQQRLKDTEDHFTERKENAHEHRIRETIVAFANSAVPEKPGIIYIGITDKGEIRGIENPDKAQKDVSSWAKSCFPPVPVIPIVFVVEDKVVLAIVVPASAERPHFAKTGYKRIGSQNFPLDESEVDQWIEYRGSKLRVLLGWTGKDITVSPVSPARDLRGSISGSARGISYGVPAGDYRLVDCNAYWITLKALGPATTHTVPLSVIDMKMDDEKHQLMLLIVPYF